MEASLTFRVCLALLRVIARVVPTADRDAWLREWEAELRARWLRLAAKNQLDRRQQMDVLRRVLGSVRDAAWFHRQFTRDAEILQDVRHGARLLRRSPGFALLAVLVLALGTGATVGIFSVVDTLLIRQLPYPDADRIVLLFEARADNRNILDDVAPANFLDWREQVRLFDSIACAEPWGFNYSGGSEPETFNAALVSEGFFEAFGVLPELGRTFVRDDFTKGRNNVVVISYGLWQRKFGGDPAIVGRTVVFDDDGPHTVVGVMPRRFEPRLLPTSGERGIWAPKIFQEYERRVRGGGYWQVVGRVKRGVTVEQAQSELDGISRRLAAQYPRTNAEEVGQIVTLRDHLAGDLKPALGVLFGAVALLLLIAAANVANLLLARAAERQRELAVRSAIGAGRARLVRQMLAESLLLAALGSVAGLAVAYWTVRLVVGLSPADIPRLDAVTIDARVLAFAMLLTGTVAIVVGVFPAWHSSGGRLLDVLRGLSAGAASGPSRHHVRSTLVVAEVALALLLMTGAGLLLRSFATLLQTNPGFNPDRVIALQVFLWNRQQTPAQRAAFIQQIVDRMRGVPGVQSVGAVSAMPFIEANINMETALLVEGRPMPPQGQEPSAFLTIATPDYFPTMRIPLREGRLFTPHDRFDGARVAIVSEALARQNWPGSSPVGQRVRYRYQGQMQNAEIVGVVASIRHDALDLPPRAEIFVPHSQIPFGSMTLVARSSGDPAALTDGLKAQIYALDRIQTIYRIATAEELVSKSLIERRFILALIGAFAVLAVVLAATGIYGVIAVTTTQRTREIGVRVALGAGRGEILGMVLRQGLLMAGAGVAIGLIGALAIARVLRGFLYGVTPFDPLTLGGVAASLVAVAIVASVLPARRATRVDPLVALRTE
jgi:putative ABC transport system permease protein